MRAVLRSPGNPGGAQSRRTRAPFQPALQLLRSAEAALRPRDPGVSNGNQAVGLRKWEFHLPDFVLLDFGFHGNLGVGR